MKIGIDVRLWSETGVGRYIRNLVSELAHIDDQNSYVLFVRPAEVSSIKYQVLSIRPEWKIISTDIRWHTVSEQFHFPRIIAAENLDLMHFPYFSVPIYYKKPYIVTIHDVILHHFETGEASTLPMPFYKLKYAGYKYVIENAAKQAKKIIVVTEATKKEVMEVLKVPEGKIAVTYEGVDNSLKFPRKGDPSDKGKSLKLREIGEKYFLHVGNLYPHKNIPRLLEAFKQVAVAHPDTKLVLVGKHDFFTEKTVRYVRNRNLEDHIVFLGHVSDEELANLYHFAEGVVIPSLMEGFGLPAVEAMQQKTLVLASDIPALREVCADAAMYFDPNSTNSIAEAMIQVLEAKSSEFKKHIEAGEKQLNQFSWEKMAKQTLEVYKNS